MKAEEHTELIPFIANFAERRKEGQPLPGVYDEDLNLVVVNKKGKVPLIEAYRGIETLTKTEATRESDEGDEALIETVTKTNTVRESDDDWNQMLDVMTKTFVERESDDNDHQFLVEMYTKTKMDREGDDHHPEL